MILILLIIFGAWVLWAAIIKIFAAQVSKPEPQKPYEWDSFEKSGPWRE